MAKKEQKAAGESRSTITDQFVDIATDLFSIEVNIILRDNITAQKMPNVRHALLDIGKEYCAALAEMEIWRQQYRQQQGMSSVSLQDNIFDTMRQELGYVTEQELLQRNDAELMNKDMIVSHRVDTELGGFDAFDVLRNWADSIIDDMNKEIFLSPYQLSVLPRIKDNADVIKGIYSTLCRHDLVLNDPDLPDERNLEKQLELMPEDRMNPNTIVKVSKWLNFERTIELTNGYSRSDLVNSDDIPPLPISEAHLVTIRKIWELGTEVIAMQTIVQVDGDVITRLNPYYLDETRYPKLQDYHNRGVSVALEHWVNLVNVAKELIVATTQAISGKVSR
jgi:hypothetical protein